MKGHFYKNLNLHQLIIDRQPKVVVECGAGNGDCTRLLLATRLEVPFELHVISDKALPDLPIVTAGISYVDLLKFPENSIDLCILDTDHNYWTLMQELHSLRGPMREGGLIVMHDVDDFYHNTGLAMSYWNDATYPEQQIMDNVCKGGLGLALIDFLTKYRGEFQLKIWIPEHHGCAVIEKKTVIQTQVIRPGTDPVFAKKPL